MASMAAFLPWTAAPRYGSRRVQRNSVDGWNCGWGMRADRWYTRLPIVAPGRLLFGTPCSLFSINLTKRRETQEDARSIIKTRFEDVKCEMIQSFRGWSTDLSRLQVAGSDMIHGSQNFIGNFWHPLHETARLFVIICLWDIFKEQEQRKR